jgi:hypothetical protein
MDLIRELLLSIDGLTIRQGEAHFLTVNQPPLAGACKDLDLIAYNMQLLAGATNPPASPTARLVLG